MTKKMSLFHLLRIGLFAFFIPLVIAQTASTGALSGTIKDTSGAVIPNATVTITSADSGQKRTAQTGTDGSYKFSLLPPGLYRVRVEAAGFKVVEIPNANVNVTETAVLDRSLEVGSAQTQTVTVEESVEAVQTASSALGTVVGSRTMTELPLNTRNYTNLLAMTAGANTSVNNATTIGKGSTNIAVNGGGTAQNTYLQDGVSVNNWQSLGTTSEGAVLGGMPIPNPDAIAEFKIITSNFDAGYGRNPGSNVNVITKSGTNSFHGTGFEFLRNRALNANDWFRNATGGDKLVLNSNVYGGVIGGPIKKDKLFFFGSYQETGQKSGASAYSYSTVNLPPIPGGSRGNCPVNFSSPTQCDPAGQAFIQNLGAAVCPANHGNAAIDKVQAGGADVACDGSNINPVAVKALQLQLPGGNYLIPGSGLPATATSTGYAASTFTQPSIFRDHQFMGNADYVISAKNTLAARYEYETDIVNAPFPALNALEPLNTLPGGPVKIQKSNHAALLKLTTILTNNLVNEARASFQRSVATNTENAAFTNSSIGINALNPADDNLSLIQVSGLFAFGYHMSFASNSPTNQFQLADQISWAHGKHSFRAGFEGERVRSTITQTAVTQGQPTFASFGDFLIGRAGCAPFSAICNGGTASNVSTVGANTVDRGFPFDRRMSAYNAFVQDDIKISQRLTVNLGVRWEYDGFITEATGDVTDLWPSLVPSAALPGTGCVGSNGKPLGAGAAGTGCSLVGFVAPSNYNGPLPLGLIQSGNPYPSRTGPPLTDFAPRFGFAWQPTGSNRWVLRGGGGYFYDRLSGNVGTGSQGISKTGPAVVFPSAGDPGATFATPWVLPGVIAGPAGTAGFTPRWFNPATGASSNLSAPGLDENLTVPLTYEWNLNTQWEFLPRWVLELGYVGTHGIHQASTSSISGTDGTAVAVPFNLAQLVGPGCVSCALSGVTTNSAAAGNVNSRVPLLGVSSQVTELQTNSNYKFNSLQATVRRQLTKGFQMQAAYTWSRAFNQSPQGVNTYPYLVNTYGPATYYRPQRLVINYVWELPFGQHKGALGKITEGWALSGVTQIQDGQPLTITDSNGGRVFGAPRSLSTANYCPGVTSGNILSSGSLSSRVGNGLNGGSGYFNASASLFCAMPTIGAIGGVGGANGFGNAGFGIVLGPPQDNWDVSISKSTRIREGQTLLFRGEFFNTFNHPQFDIPDTGANSGTWGQIIRTAVNPRVIQFAVKYAF
jgi:hypothetical protein